MNIFTFTPEQQQEWDNWVASKPSVIQEMALQYPPNKLYLIPAGQRVTILSYSENKTVTVTVRGKYNNCIFERNVFGIPISDLTECDIPTEPTKAFLTDPQDVDDFIDATRPMILVSRKYETKTKPSLS